MKTNLDDPAKKSALTENVRPLSSASCPRPNNLAALGVALLGLGWTLTAGVAGAADFYVAPDGSDQNPGTKEKPFATLVAARDALRADAARPATVWLAPGDYSLEAPLELGAADSGKPDAPVTFRAEEPGTARLLGARRLKESDFSPVTDPATEARLAPEAKGKVVSLDLKALGVKHSQTYPDVFLDSGDLLQLFADGRRLPVSRFPNAGYMTMKKVLYNAGGPTGSNWEGANWEHKDESTTGGVFEYREEFYDKHAAWSKQTERGVWMKGYWRIPWQNEAIRVLSIDTGNHTVTFAKPIPGGIGNKYTRPAGNGQESYWLMNLLEEVDAPGEWCVDFTTQKLYLLPPAPLDKSELLLADNTDPVVRLKDASYVVLRGLTIEANCGHGVSVEGGESDTIAGCTIRNVNRYAVEIEGGKNHAVQSCDLYNLGAGGVFLGGGDETSNPRVPCGHRVVNNHIHHFAQIERVYAPGVNVGFTGGGSGGHHTCVGAYVAHNLIHDTPHAGVLFGSYDSVMEYNEIFRFCTVSNDMGAFYSYDKAERFGNITIRYNLMHSSDDGDAVYFDHDHPDMKIFGNIVWLKSKGKRGTSYLYKNGSQGLNPQFINCQNNIAIQSNFGYELVSALTAESTIKNNVAVQCKTPYAWATVGAGKDGKKAPCPEYPAGKNMSYDADPGFVDMANFDFRLKPDAQLLKDLPDFQPIPAEKIGLYMDEFRTTLPTAEEIDREGKRPHETGLGYEVLDRHN